MVSIFEQGDNCMNLDWISFSYWDSIKHPEAWGGVFTGLATIAIALATVIAVIVAAIMAYRHTKKLAAATHNESIRHDKLQRKIKALEDIWSLLAYMSPQRSQSAIIQWSKRKGKKIYFFHFDNLERFFMQEVSQVFYKRHAGLHISKEIRDQVFEYLHKAGVLYFCHHDKNNHPADSLIELKEQSKAKELINIYHSLNHNLKQELEDCYQQLSWKG